MKIGYRRVSTHEQNLDRQDLGQLDKVFEEKTSGSSAKQRPELQAMIEFARGVYKGRKPTIDVQQILDLKGQGLGQSQIAQELGISRVSVYTAMNSVVS